MDMKPVLAIISLTFGGGDGRSTQSNSSLADDNFGGLDGKDDTLVAIVVIVSQSHTSILFSFYSNRI
jgi:hypothetical protein